MSKEEIVKEEEKWRERERKKRNEEREPKTERKRKRRKENEREREKYGIIGGLIGDRNSKVKTFLPRKTGPSRHKNIGFNNHSFFLSL